jgi:serine/threonine protein kinase
MGMSRLNYLLKFNCKEYLMHPEFVFSTKNKVHMIMPFMIGGNLARKISMSVKISQELAYFYIAQLLIIL